MNCLHLLATMMRLEVQLAFAADRTDRTRNRLLRAFRLLAEARVRRRYFAARARLQRARLSNPELHTAARFLNR